MDKTAAHVKWVRGPESRIAYYKEELVQVQTLFYERRYKHCIALCEQLQRPEVSYTDSDCDLEETQL